MRLHRFNSFSGTETAVRTVLKAEAVREEGPSESQCAVDRTPKSDMAFNAPVVYDWVLVWGITLDKSKQGRESLRERWQMSTPTVKRQTVEVFFLRSILGNPNCHGRQRPLNALEGLARKSFRKLTRDPQVRIPKVPCITTIKYISLNPLISTTLTGQMQLR